MKYYKTLTLVLTALLCWSASWACTSMLVSAGKSATGHPLMWKNRDTGAPDNFLARVEADSTHEIGFVALFNGGDSLLREAWMGMNDAGFAIMNTASYNLMPDTAQFKDQEGIVMAAALKKSRTAKDFENLLETWGKPMGVQANFAIMDAQGNQAYYECDDYNYVKFDMNADSLGYLVRTNFSLTGNDTDGFGYARCQATYDLLKTEMDQGRLAPWSFTEKASRSFWHGLIQQDFSTPDHGRWVVDQDFIPRNITTASVVIEGVLPGEDPKDMRMWITVGYPPCSSVQLVTLDNIPDGLLPTAEGWHSPDNLDVLKLKEKAFPIHKGNGQKYIDMEYLRSLQPSLIQKSHLEYEKVYGVQ